VVFVFAGRIAARRQTPGIKFTRSPKISIFAPQGRFVVLIRVKFGKAKGHLGPLGHAKFHANRCPEVRTRPKNGKFRLFGKESPTRDESVGRFLQLLGAFYTPIHSALVFYI